MGKYETRTAMREPELNLGRFSAISKTRRMFFLSEYFLRAGNPVSESCSNLIEGASGPSHSGTGETQKSTVRYDSRKAAISLVSMAPKRRVQKSKRCVAACPAIVTNGTLWNSDFEVARSAPVLDPWPELTEGLLDCPRSGVPRTSRGARCKGSGSKHPVLVPAVATLAPPHWRACARVECMQTHIILPSVSPGVFFPLENPLLIFICPVNQSMSDHFSPKASTGRRPVAV